jgi:hypothetical protein
VDGGSSLTDCCPAHCLAPKALIVS